MKHAPWTKSECSAMGKRGGSASGERRRRASMLKTIGSIEREARAALFDTRSSLTPEDFKAIAGLLARVYFKGWKRGYQAGWRKDRASLEQARKRDAAA